jgi:hypothetical protein
MVAQVQLVEPGGGGQFDRRTASREASAAIRVRRDDMGVLPSRVMACPGSAVPGRDASWESGPARLAPSDARKKVVASRRAVAAWEG